MVWFRGAALAALLIVVQIALGGAAMAQSARPDAPEVLRNWYRLVLELVRHTPTYSPPVASRTFGYVGVVAYEAVASGDPALRSLAGQLNGLTGLPARQPGAEYDEGTILHAALSQTAAGFFFNTGPTGQRAMAAMTNRMGARLAEGLDPAVAARSTALGQQIADHVRDWSRQDGGDRIENMGFAQSHTPAGGKAHWVPTSLVRQQQAPLLPDWGQNRPFVMPTGRACPLPPPPDYSEDPESPFHAEALEVVTITAALTEEQVTIARFWADDAMLSFTPPGHWIAIAMQVLDEKAADLPERVDVLARLGLGMADAFIGCWQAKFEYDLLRPVTYIRRVIDAAWQPLLLTPPFPEYPSGHSTQSGAAAQVLTHLFGDNYAFTDTSLEDEGLEPRSFSSFNAAAEEAGISRLYGGIHFRAAIERGLEQGRCIGAYVNALQTRIN